MPFSTDLVARIAFGVFCGLTTIGTIVMLYLVLRPSKKRDGR